MKKNSVKIFLIIATFGLMAFFANSVLAAELGSTFDIYKNFLNQAGQQGTYNVGLQASESYFDTLLGRLIMTVIGLTGLIFLGLVIYSGFQWMTAGGNEEKVGEAKKRVLNGVIGLAIALLAFILTSALFNYFDQRFLKQTDAGVQPPVRNLCSNDAQCENDPLGFQCLTLNGQNVCGCGGDDECPGTSQCIRSQCQEAMCNDDNDCDDNELGFQCVRLNGLNVCGCGGDDECPDQSACIRNQCQEVACTNNSHCRENLDGNKCRNYQCACNTIADCPQGLNPTGCSGTCQYGD